LTNLDQLTLRRFTGLSSDKTVSEDLFWLLLAADLSLDLLLAAVERADALLLFFGGILDNVWRDRAIKNLLSKALYSPLTLNLKCSLNFSLIIIGLGEVISPTYNSTNNKSNKLSSMYTTSTSS